ncbi:AAA family ATPase, partial [Chitinophaga sp.]|uniref:AAA family ATPase n=1 Tax=Chitinophaga sp. TaxID=1869181 RepID=UPI0031D078C9
EGMLPEANLVFLDELLNANSAILNSLLMALNEKIFRRGKETNALPALLFIGASNHLPEDEALQALFDRFLLRVHCDNVDPADLEKVLQAGWQLEQAAITTPAKVSAEEVRELQHITTSIDLSAIRGAYITLIQQLRNAGIQISDRRAVKLQRLIAASAVLCKRDAAILSDMWVLRYIWDTEEQQEIISAIVNAALVVTDEQTAAHPRATINSAPDADAIYREVQQMTVQWEAADTSPAERALIKDRLRYLNDRCEWINNDTQKNFVLAPIDHLWEKIMQNN